uniref:MIF4G domain containing n=1 Tax=Pipistrellus kuhlii TaxID=59472 RepID=A0A7J7SET3_PIPKU|nr:MIF4G domain containing [Pipistrellus kuhlii]
MCYAVIQVGERRWRRGETWFRSGQRWAEMRRTCPRQRGGSSARSSGEGCDGTARPQCRHPSSGSQAESKQAGQSVFRRGLLNRLQQEYQAREQLRARSPRGWVCYVTFICNIFDYLRVNNMPMMALVNPVYDCLFRLAQPDSLSEEEEVDCLVLQLHRVGEQLEKMNRQRMDELFVLIRDGFLLLTDLSSLAQLLLLEIIEFRAAGWKMTPAAHKYYYSEVSD